MKVRVKMTFGNMFLGTNPGNPDLFRDYIWNRKKAEYDEDKVMEEAQYFLDPDTEIEKGTTMFTRNKAGQPTIWDYQIKGFYKEAAKLLSECEGTKTNHGFGTGRNSEGQQREKVDPIVEKFFCLDRQSREIPLILPEGETTRIYQRPIRISDAAGKRVALAASEVVPEGTTCEYSLRLMRDSDLPILREILAFGSLRGSGQWRNSGQWGRFTSSISLDDGETWETMDPMKEFPNHEIVGVRLTFTDPMLGTNPGDDSLYSNFVSDNDFVDEETMIERATTTFKRMPDGAPALLSYHVRGFLKESIASIHKLDWSAISTIYAYKQKVESCMHILGSMIRLDLPEGEEVGILQRPLIATNAKGKMTTLACSEVVPEGTTAEFQIFLMNKKDEVFLNEALAYGEFSGIGQWRGSGKGRFTTEIKTGDDKWKQLDFDTVVAKSSLYVSAYSETKKRKTAAKK